ncbi:MAG: PIG-L family deacetylase [Chloroflexi bacterium]|nr:PIG-L family deacetylase [Chloroflexota bacterium]
MKHLFLSPHPDDAVLSCGGLIYQLVQAGETVQVFTVTSGAIPPEVLGQPFVIELLARWQLGADPIAGRQAEDVAALAVLGGTMQFGSIPDAPYRLDAQGHQLYPDRDAIFGDLDSRDPALNRLREITENCDPQAVIYAPLGVGHHVDHLLAQKAILVWLESFPEVAFFFYEEYPYCAEGDDRIQAARAILGRPTQPIIHLLDQAAIEAKIQAIACYQSQISTFWSSPAAMAEAVQHYAVQVGQGSYAERVWKPQ